MRKVSGMRSGLVVIACVSLLAACAAPYQMLREARPNPLFGARTFALEPLHYESMVVGDHGMPGATWLAQKKPEQQASFVADEQAMNGAFDAAILQRAGRLQIILGPPPPDGSAFLIRPIVVRYEPGFYAYVASQPTEVELRVQVMTAQGQLIDELAMQSTVYASMGNPSTGGRMREAGDNLGWRLSDYLRHRTQQP